MVMPRLVEVIKRQREEGFIDSDSDSDYGEIIAEGDDVLLNSFGEQHRDDYDDSEISPPLHAPLHEPVTTDDTKQSTTEVDKVLERKPNIYFIPHYCIKLETVSEVASLDSSYINGSYMGTTVTAKKVAYTHVLPCILYYFQIY